MLILTEILQIFDKKVFTLLVLFYVKKLYAQINFDSGIRIFNIE